MDFSPSARRANHKALSISSLRPVSRLSAVKECPVWHRKRSSEASCTLKRVPLHSGQVKQDGGPSSEVDSIGVLASEISVSKFMAFFFLFFAAPLVWLASTVCKTGAISRKQTTWSTFTSLTAFAGISG